MIKVKVELWMGMKKELEVDFHSPNCCGKSKSLDNRNVKIYENSQLDLDNWIYG